MTGQLQNVPAREWIRALERDRAVRDVGLRDASDVEIFKAAKQSDILLKQGSK